MEDAMNGQFTRENCQIMHYTGAINSRITSGPCIGSRQKNTGYDGSNMSASDTIKEQKLAITHPIQPHKVIIPFSSIELNGKPSGISCQVWKLSTECDSRVAMKIGVVILTPLRNCACGKDQYPQSFSLRLTTPYFGQMRHVFRRLEVSERATPTYTQSTIFHNFWSR